MKFTSTICATTFSDSHIRYSGEFIWISFGLFTLSIWIAKMIYSFSAFFFMVNLKSTHKTLDAKTKRKKKKKHSFSFVWIPQTRAEEQWHLLRLVTHIIHENSNYLAHLCTFIFIFIFMYYFYFKWILSIFWTQRKCFIVKWNSKFINSVISCIWSAEYTFQFLEETKIIQNIWNKWSSVKLISLLIAEDLFFIPKSTKVKLVYALQQKFNTKQHLGANQLHYGLLLDEE